MGEISEQLLRDYIEVQRTSNVQAAIANERTEQLIIETVELRKSFSNGTVGKLIKKIDGLWRTVMGLLVPIIGIIFLLLKLLSEMKP